MNPKGSAGGCYLLPLALPPEARRSSSRVRILSLTPPGVSTNEVLHFIVDDLVESSVNGITSHNPSGISVKIFIDVVAFIGDYPAAAHTVDLIGHTGSSPCTLCTFRRRPAQMARGSRYGYTCDVHANNSTFLRHAERQSAVRSSGINEKDANRLGMVANSRISERNCPLLRLQQELERKADKIPLTEKGDKVISGYFDPYRSNLVAPDHLLTGLAKNILNAVYISLPSNDIRLRADVFICSALRENGLITQNQIFNPEKKKLHTMSLSSVFCVLLVSVPIFKILTSELDEDHLVQKLVKLIEMLQQLVAFTYWWPEASLDGLEAEDLVRRKKEDYFASLKSLSKKYVEGIDKICSESCNVKKLLDKPNLHRLIELYEHSVPSFGHVREFMELIFECAHQPLKRCIARSNNRQAHISAVEHCVGNDWQGRLASLQQQVSSAEENKRLIARRGIRRLILGPTSDLLSKEKDFEFISETDIILDELFVAPLTKQLQTNERIGHFGSTGGSIWLGRGRVTVTELESLTRVPSETIEKVVQYSREVLHAYYPPVYKEDEDTVRLAELFKEARRVHCRPPAAESETSVDTTSYSLAVSSMHSWNMERKEISLFKQLDLLQGNLPFSSLSQFCKGKTKLRGRSPCAALQTVEKACFSLKGL